MNSVCSSILIPFNLILLLLLFSFSEEKTSEPQLIHERFFQCLSTQFSEWSSISKLIYTPYNASYLSILDFSIRNTRFDNPSTMKPLVIITPTNVSHVQATIKCSRKTQLQIRIRCGGHDYEGLSYLSNDPFVLIDLIKLNSVEVDLDERTAWVQAGAILGEVYHAIAEKSTNLGFPAGICPTVGVSGHFSGGGEGNLMRKYGVAADNIIDAQLVDVEGRFLPDRESMGEDLFWAIRGGGAESFGVVIAWKIQLVPVPSTVTVFTISKNLEQNATQLVHKWQYMASNIHEDLSIMVNLKTVSDQDGNNTIQASFNSLFLGVVDNLLPLMQSNFPELGLSKQDCTEMSWIESILYFNGYFGESTEVLLNRTGDKTCFKAKSDYVKVPIPTSTGWDEIWKMLYEEDVGNAQMIMMPYGGRMNQIPQSEIPYPHRAGNIYQIQYTVGCEEVFERHLSWIKKFYANMTRYVSKNPRTAYLNYRDLDIGRNSEHGSTSYAQASIWGLKYFQSNFYRLVLVKTMIDPSNFFRNEQSIPPLSLHVKKMWDI